MTQIRDSPPNAIILGLDLGQANDYTALSVTEAQTDVAHRLDRYAVRALDRWRPRRYQDVVARVAEILPKLTASVLVHRHVGFVPMRPRVTLVLDRTGVGRAVGDLFTEARLDVDLQLVSITGGADVVRDPTGGWRVPKRDLAGVVSVALQNGRLEIANQLEHAATLRAELKNFRARISATGHDSYGAGDDWREGNHDDLVLAVALSVWWGEHTNAQGGVAISQSYAGLGEADLDDIDDLWGPGWAPTHARP